MIDLDKVQEMWVKDSKIDMDNLHTESTNIPSLHAKYFELYNTIFLLRKKAEQHLLLILFNYKEVAMDITISNTTYRFPILKNAEIIECPCR